ncbi:Os12g0141050, partial [Oryza sativa Japonica Group]
MLLLEHEHQDMDTNIEKHRQNKNRDVHGFGRLPAAPSGVSSDQAKQVQNHGDLQRTVLDPLRADHVAQEEDEDDQRRDEGGGVGVEEHHVSPVIRDVKNRIAGEVMAVSVGAIALPEASRRVQSCLVCDARRENPKQEQVHARFL